MFRGVPFGLERFAGVTGALAAAAALFSPTAHAAEKASDERRLMRPLGHASRTTPNYPSPLVNRGSWL